MNSKDLQKGLTKYIVPNLLICPENIKTFHSKKIFVLITLHDVMYGVSPGISMGRKRLNLCLRDPEILLFFKVKRYCHP